MARSHCTVLSVCRKCRPDVYGNMCGVMGQSTQVSCWQWPYSAAASLCSSLTLQGPHSAGASLCSHMSSWSTAYVQGALTKLGSIVHTLGHTCLGPQTPHGGSVSPDSWASMGSNCDLSGSWEPSLLSPILDICVSPHAQLAKAGLCPPSHFSPVLYLLWLSSARAEYEGHTGPLRTNKASFLEFSSMTKQLRKDQHVSRHLLYIWVNWGMSVEPRLHTPFGSSDCKPTTPLSTLLQLPPTLTVCS